jgi:hypothetical protein
MSLLSWLCFDVEKVVAGWVGPKALIRQAAADGGIQK